MLKLKIRRGRVDAAQMEDFAKVLQELGTEWEPVIRPSQELQQGILGLDPKSVQWGAPPSRDSFDQTQPTVAGEIFRVTDGLVIVSLANDARGSMRYATDAQGRVRRETKGEKRELRLEVASLLERESDTFLTRVSKLVQQHLGVELVPYVYKNERFDELRKELVAEDLPDGPEYVAASMALMDREARTLAVGIKSSRGLLARDSGKLLDDPTERDARLAALESAGVIETEIVVVCTTSGNQVARVNDEASMKKLAKEGLRCACGKPIDEEVADRLHSITAIGTLLLDKSRWMSVLTRSHLEGLGVPKSDILLECQLGSDEIDCVALISGELAMFELKDKDFNIGNAYSFGAKISIIRPQHALIVTTESVVADVKAHFSRTKADPRQYVSERERQAIYYVEGPTFLNQLDPIVGGIYEKDGEAILDGVLPLVSAKSKAVTAALRSRPSEHRPR